MRFLPVNLDALLVELDDLQQTLALLASLNAQPVGGVRELVPAARTILVRYDPSRTDMAALAADIGARRLDGAVRQGGARIEVPVHYLGEDLDDVGRLLGIAPQEVVRRHTGQDYSVAFTGFAPGFAYLADGHPGLEVPRRPSPRTRVPAGAVALAGTFSAVYPQDSPGGWQLIGVTPMTMWDVTRGRPAALLPGDRVRFVDAATLTDAQIAALCDVGGQLARQGLADVPSPTASRHAPASPGKAQGASEGAGVAAGATAAAVAGTDADAAAAALPPSAPVAPALPGAAGQGAILTVRATGLQALFQDAGRHGMAGLGVSASGALDQTALRAANRLVGNAPAQACVESTSGGLALQCAGDAVVAVTGADLDVTVSSRDGRQWRAPRYQAFALGDGDRLSLGQPRAGVRAYVAVRGGYDVTPVLGSCATDTLARVGPPALRVGDSLPAGVQRVRQPVGEAQVALAHLPVAGQITTLDIVMGPRTDWFTQDAIERLCAQDWRVTEQSNRIGMRLAGEQALTRLRKDELPSEGTRPGAIQVPASGQPVLFLADHPLTGGYPVIASIATYHLDLAGQVPVGALLRFRPISEFPQPAACQADPTGTTLS